MGYDKKEDKEKIIEATEKGLKLDPAMFKKHYRYILKTTLEESGLIDKAPFDQFEMFRGKRIESEGGLFSFISKLVAKESSYKKVGTVKGWVEVFSDKD